MAKVTYIHVCNRERVKNGRAKFLFISKCKPSPVIQIQLHIWLCATLTWRHHTLGVLQRARCTTSCYSRTFLNTSLLSRIKVSEAKIPNSVTASMFYKGSSCQGSSCQKFKTICLLLVHELLVIKNVSFNFSTHLFLPRASLVLHKKLKLSLCLTN
jgi:hypothetical protein